MAKATTKPKRQPQPSQETAAHIEATTKPERQPRLNKETVAHIYEAATKTLEGMNDNLDRVMNMAQSNLAISAVLLGLLINASLSSASQLNVAAKEDIIFAIALLTIALMISVLVPILTRNPTGYLYPDKVYEEFYAKPITNVYRVEISYMSDAIKAFNFSRKWRIALVNITRLAIAAAILLASRALASSI